MDIFKKDLSFFEKKAYQGLLPIVRILQYYKVSPKTVTVTGIVISIVVCVFIAREYLVSAAVGIIFIVITDMTDGLLARYTNSPSRFGTFLDSTIDRYVEGFIFIGLFMLFWHRSVIISVMVLVSMMGAFLVSYARARSEGLGMVWQKRFGLMRRKRRMILLFVGLLVGVYRLSFLGAAIVLLAVLCNYTALLRIFYVRHQLPSITQ